MKKPLLLILVVLALVHLLFACAALYVAPDSDGYCTCADDPEAAAEIEAALKADSAELQR